MTEEMLSAEMFEPDGYGEDQWRTLLDWADATAEAGRRVVLDEVPESARWQIKDEADAEWAMARFREHVAEIDEVNARYDQWISELEGQRSRRLARASAGAAYLEVQLTMWGQHLRYVNPDVATLHLAAGALRTRKVNERPVVEDQASLVAWFEANGRKDEVKVTKSVPMATLAKVGQVAEVIVQSACELQCGDQTIVDGVAEVGQVAACNRHPGDLVMISEILGTVPARVFVHVDAEGNQVELPGTRVEPARISVSVDPLPVTGA